jgi:hypothetical protein
VLVGAGEPPKIVAITADGIRLLAERSAASLSMAALPEHVSNHVYRHPAKVFAAFFKMSTR